VSLQFRLPRGGSPRQDKAGLATGARLRGTAWGESRVSSFLKSGLAERREQRLRLDGVRRG